LDFNAARPQGDVPRGLTADEIREAITARAREFVQWVFPCAVVHRSGKFAVVGDIFGQPGDSLHIELSGPKAGQWHDWASTQDRGKDLIGLFMATNNFHASDFPRALEIINSEFLGRTTPEWTRKFTIQFKERAEKHKDKPLPQIDDRPPPSESYIYRDPAGGIIGVVRRHDQDEIDPVTGKPKKTFSVWDARACRAQAPTPRPLYRLPEIVQHNDIVFTEGERKADALASVGIEATCIMFGSNAPLDKVDWTYLAGKRVTIWPDKDKAGGEFAARLAPYLANFKCQVFVVSPPEDKPAKWDAADCIAEGGNPSALIAAAQPVSAIPAASNVFKLYTLEELEHLPPPKWLIDRVMIENGLCLFWAGSDSYKTFLAIDMACCIGSGSDWHGHSVMTGPVVYVAAEDINGVAKRMVGWRETKGRGKPKANIVLLNDSFTVASPDTDKLIRSIELLPNKPRLIVIDTLARTFGAGNEDKTSDMGAFVEGCDRIRRATGATVMIVHHTGRNTEQERGNVSLRGACDTIFTVQRVGKSGRIKLINTPPKGKQKNAEPFKDIHLRVQPVHFEHQGIEQSTLVIMPDDNDTPASGETLEDEAADTAPRLGQIEKSILKALEKAARSDRKHLGFNSLHAMVKGDSGNLGRAIRGLVQKGLVIEALDETDPKKTRRQYALSSLS
jgi:5S rRNA maturation endonuclease (ribonuclease M5)